MLKAYDRVSWQFLIAVLRRMGFARKWCQWIFQCINTVTYRVLVNGVPIEQIVPSREIRHGDPLSPYVFILLSEALIRLIHNRLDAGFIRRIRLNLRCPSITYLFFTDDTIIFGGASLDEVSQWKKMLDLYCNASGKQINFHKSSLKFSANCLLELKNQIKEVMECCEMQAGNMYLGIPTTKGKSKRKAMRYIIDRVPRRPNVGSTYYYRLLEKKL